MHEGDIDRSSVKKEKKKRKNKKYCEKESVQSKETCYANVSVPKFHEEKIDEHKPRLNSTLDEIDLPMRK